MIKALALVTLVAACSASVSVGREKTLNTDEIEQAIMDVTREHAGIALTSVKCPDDVKVQKDAEFTCDATDGQGNTVMATVTQGDSEGNVSFHVPTAGTEEAEAAVKTGLAQQTGVAVASVECPEMVLQGAGVVFTCMATTESGEQASINVTQTDEEGNIRWAVVSAQN